jgi:hypothetical protein
LGAFLAQSAKNRAFRSNSSQNAPHFAPGFPLQSLARSVQKPFFSVMLKNAPRPANRREFKEKGRNFGKPEQKRHIFKRIY